MPISNKKTSKKRSLITVGNISVVRQGQTILNDVSMEIGARDFITIIGPNGAGKSMLLKCIMGLHKPDNGTVKRNSDVKIGYVPQKMATDHTIPISVRRFLELRKNSNKTIIQEIAEEVSVSQILNRQMSLLSGGELQRVLLARALLDNPELLVLDEPAQNLDISGQLAFYKLLERVYKEREISILMVSHDLHLVMASTKQVVCLFHHICCSGEPQIVTKDPEFISLFGNDMARMMSVYHHAHDHNHDHDGESEHAHTC